MSYTRTLGPGNFVRLDLAGTNGDGTTDDTAAIQAALNAATAGSTVIGDPRATYLIGTTTTAGSFLVPSGTTSVPYCLSIPTGVTLDARGATFKLKAGTDAVLFTNSGCAAGVTTDANVGLVNVLLDGNNVTLTNKWLVQMAGVTGLKLDLKMVNVVHGGLSLMTCSQVNAPRLEADIVTGQPYSIGSNTSGKGVTDSRFGVISARNVIPDPSNTFNFPGNSFYCEMQRCTVDTIRAYNCSAGVKLAVTCTDLAIGKIVVDTCGDSGGNSGVKFQGDGTGPSRISIGQIISRAQTAHGLWMEQCLDCTVSSYTGEGNQTLGSGPDVWIGGTRDQIGELRSTNSGGPGILLRAYATDMQIGRATILNPGKAASANGNKAGVSAAGGSGTISDLTVKDNQGTPTLFRGVDITSTSSYLRVNAFLTSGFTSAAANIVSSSPVSLKTLIAGPPFYGQIVIPDAAATFDIQVFAGSGGSWAKPSGAKTVHVTALASGGGGGSGARRASATASSGGAAGGGGGFANALFDASLLGSSETVSCGAGGTGGTAIAADDTNGNAGSTGSSSSFGAKLRVQPGAGGPAGGTATSSGGSGGGGLAAGSSGGSGTLGAAGTNGGTGSMGAAGGGGGGGISSGAAAFAGGTGGSSTPLNAAAGGSGGANTGAAGGAGIAATTNLALPGSGGGGGGANVSGAGGAGGAGAIYGAGGGGGGASLNGSASGAGGAGGAGIVVVITHL